MDITFNEILESIEKMDISEREMLIDIVQKRTSQLRRRQIVFDVKSGRKDYLKGNISRGSSEDLMKEIMK